MNQIVEVKDLSIGFSYPLHEGLEFNLNEGEILFVKGRNGSGKSTLIKTILNLLKPISGNIDWKINFEKISFLPQVMSHEFPISITLGEILDIYNSVENVRELLPTNLHNRRFNDASGGERQKTLILTRLQRETEVLILDEPFNHLDHSATKEMKSFISELIETKVIKGIILISHVDVEFPNQTVKEVQLS